MKNKSALVLVALFVLSLSAQELDEGFLNSLPDDIKKDLIEKNAKTGESSGENYKISCLFICWTRIYCISNS